MVAHGMGVRAVREHGGAGARVGLVHNPEIVVPWVENEQDTAAAKKIFAQTNEHILSPMKTGHYPAAYLERCGSDAPVFTAEEMALIAQPTDFLGLNVYRGHFAREAAPGEAELLPLPTVFPRAEASWLHFVPQSIYWVSRFCTELYGTAEIYIAENGVGYFDEPDLAAELPTIHGWTQPASAKGEVLDLHRCQYLRSYLQEVQGSIEEGLPIKGYFLWSFMDNFEWADGFTSRFGIVYVDYVTLARQPKLSAEWYRQVIANNRVL
jgi:beta-glucosidase